MKEEKGFSLKKFSECKPNSYLVVSELRVRRLVKTQHKGYNLLYDKFQYLIQTWMTPQSRRDPSPFLSLSKWSVELAKRLWNVHLEVQDSKTFFFAFQSPWQRRMLLKHGVVFLNVQKMKKIFLLFFCSFMLLFFFY
ncbi:hypothetical protein VP01_2744g3 [Puccinia sorghi]|uniref:Uncharacterized protein n=1 Tax=Puccinia sorghi TaxID=27349 RepID=A0A0L6V4X8_9BASI|nr:hypothetical protein VP01_2744g3 [Puccinia sorghi]